MGETHREPFDDPGFLPGGTLETKHREETTLTKFGDLIELKCQRLDVRKA